MKNLYSIELSYLQLMQDIEENEGILEEEQEKQLEITKENFAETSENLIKIVKTLESQIDFCNKEIERINKLSKVKQNMIDRLEKSLLEAIKLFGEKDPKKDIWRYEVGSFKLSTRQSKQVVIDEELIGNEWKTVVIKDRLTLVELDNIIKLLGKPIKATTDILKTPIKEQLDMGIEIEGASIETKYGLTIK